MKYKEKNLENTRYIKEEREKGTSMCVSESLQITCLIFISFIKYD